MRWKMDITVNIIQEKLPEKCLVSEEEAKKILVCDPVDQQLANIDLDDEDVEETDTGCPWNSDNLFECPGFFDTDEDDDPDTVECGKCGRMDWKKKQSVGRGDLI